MDRNHFDAIVIGSGQGANPLVQALGAAGMKTALVEREHLGGTCINEGCTPTKTMLASARVAYLAKRGVDYGVRTGEISVDLGKVRERKRAIVNSFRNGTQSRIEKAQNVELICGAAEFAGSRTVRVRKADGKEEVLEAGRIFINAGCRPAVPDIPGLREVPFLNSTTVMELDALPEHLLILGGGYVGLEFGQMFRRFGSPVTIIQSGRQLLSGEDSDIAETVRDLLCQDGIEVLLNAKVSRVTGAPGAVVLHVESGGRTQQRSGSHLLISTGRVPNTDLLRVKEAGIAIDGRGFIKVNDQLETNVTGVYALGDIKGGPAFTHISYDDFRIIRTNLLEKGNASIAGRLVPYTLFIDPQLGRVGMTEREARESGKKIHIAKMEMSKVARALEVDETRGLMKVIVDAESGQILGAAILGIEGGEIMSLLQLAMMGKLTYTTLREAVFAHPTLAESLNNLFAKFVAE